MAQVNKARKKVFRFLITTVGALGLCSMTLLLTDPPNAESENVLSAVPSLFTMNSSIMAASRNVASNDESHALTKETLFELKCDDGEPRLETANPRFRLKGEACASGDSALLKTQVQNKSNGYVATVFHRTPTSFTTDYINLSEGQNEIDVRFETDKGMVEKTITVVRNPVRK
jgi:hypothetical protein